MTVAQRVQNLFRTFEEIWGVIPGYFKVFLYASISTTFGLWIAGQLDIRAVIIVVATNLGIYQGPRTVNKLQKTLL